MLETVSLTVFLLVILFSFLGEMCIRDRSYTAGVYTAQAHGNNGPVTVEVEVSDDEILSVKVTEHAETAGSVSYTHLDVYKRQGLVARRAQPGGGSRAPHGAEGFDPVLLSCLLYTSRCV